LRGELVDLEVRAAEKLLTALHIKLQEPHVEVLVRAEMSCALNE
jgi:hypothetical protein